MLGLGWPRPSPRPSGPSRGPGRPQIALNTPILTPILRAFWGVQPNTWGHSKGFGPIAAQKGLKRGSKYPYLSPPGKGLFEAPEQPWEPIWPNPA